MRLSICKVCVVCLTCVLPFSGCSGSAVYDGRAYSIESQETDRERIIGVIREVLTDYRFVIDRVDGRRGVVTTHYKSTQGIASPWDSEQGSFQEETADLVNQHERSVRVLISDDGSMDVSVIVRRIHRPGWRIETESIGQSTHTVIIDENGKRQPAQVADPIGIDGDLSERIGVEILKRLTAD